MNRDAKHRRRPTAERLEFLVAVLGFSAAGLGAAIARGAWGWVALDGLLATASLGITITHLRRLACDRAFSRPAISLAPERRSLS